MKDDTSPATKADIRRIEQILDRIIDEHLPKLQQSTNDRFDRLEEAQRTSFEFLLDATVIGLTIVLGILHLVLPAST